MRSIIGMCKRVECKIGDRLNHGEHLFHFLYLGAIMIEGHGIVSIFAGGGFISLLAYIILYEGWDLR